MPNDKGKNIAGTQYGQGCRNPFKRKPFPALSRPHAFSRTWKRAVFVAASQPDQYNASTNPRGWMRDYSQTPFGPRLDEAGWVDAWFDFIADGVQGGEAYDHVYIWSGGGLMPEAYTEWGSVTSPEQLTYYWTSAMTDSWPTFKARLRDELGVRVSLYAGIMNTPIEVIDGTRSFWNTGVGGPTYTGTEWLTAANYERLADGIARLRDEGYLDEQYGMDAFYFVQLERTAQSLAFTDRLVNHHGIKTATEGPHAALADVTSVRKFWRQYAEMAVATGGSLESGRAQAGGASTITLAAGASGTDDAYNGYKIVVGDETKTISDYVGSTRVATVNSAWTTQPVNNTAYRIFRDVTAGADWSTFTNTIRNSSRLQYAPGSVQIMFCNGGVWTTEQKATMRAEAESRSWLEISVPGTV